MNLIKWTSLSNGSIITNSAVSLNHCTEVLEELSQQHIDPECRDLHNKRIWCTCICSTCSLMSSEIKMIVKLETVLASNYLYVMALVIKLLYIYIHNAAQEKLECNIIKGRAAYQELCTVHLDRLNSLGSIRSNFRLVLLWMCTASHLPIICQSALSVSRPCQVRWPCRRTTTPFSAGNSMMLHS